MSKVIMLKGLPASGKSTWAKEYIEKHPGTKRINKDLMREMFDFEVWSHENEKMVLQIRDTLIKQFLKEGYDVIIDDTNFSHRHENRIRAILPKNVTFEVNDSFLEVPLEECLKRNKGRVHEVPDDVIQGMYDTYLANTDKEKRKRDSVQQIKKKYDPTISASNDVFIFDIDGTIADTSHRSPYDQSTMEQDEPIQDVIDLLNFLSTRYLIIFVTGRKSQSDAVQKTLEWIDTYTNKTHPYDIFMRSADDNRSDVKVKEDIYHQHIENNYNVLGVFEDRDRTVQMWRDLGLRCYQVRNGNF